MLSMAAARNSHCCMRLVVTPFHIFAGNTYAAAPSQSKATPPIIACHFSYQPGARPGTFTVTMGLPPTPVTDPHSSFSLGSRKDV